MIVSLGLFRLLELGLVVVIVLVIVITHLARLLAGGLRRWWSGPAD